MDPFTAPLYAGYTALDLLVVFIAAVLMPALSALAGAQLDREGGQPNSLIPRYLQMIVRSWLIVAIVVGAWSVQGRPFGALGLGPQLTAWDYGGLAVVFVAFAAMALQLARLKTLPPEEFERARRMMHSVKITPKTRGELALFLLLALTAGIWEELLYRGFLIWFLVHLIGVGGAIGLSSLIFALGHVYQGSAGVGRTGLIGITFAVLYVLSGTLWWLIAAHAAIDIYGGLAAYRVCRIAERQRGV